MLLNDPKLMLFISKNRIDILQANLGLSKCIGQIGIILTLGVKVMERRSRSFKVNFLPSSFDPTYKGVKVFLKSKHC